MTPFILAMNLAVWTAWVAAWLRGGHAERLAVAILLMHALLELFVRDWHVGGLDVGVAAGQLPLLLIFAWLAATSDRWWPLAAAASLALILLVHLLTLTTSVSYYAAASARVGLWSLLHLIVLGGVAERWLAGEAPVSRLAPSPRSAAADG